MLLGVYNYTVVLTYLGMLVGYTGITFAMNGNVRGAMVCLLLAGVCDMFDGRIASTKGDRTAREKRFGIQIDSLSDLLCFGALPAVIVCSVSGGGILTAVLAGLYLLCALIRLAWFNVDEEERQNRTTGDRLAYYGLPVTAAALIVPAVMRVGPIIGLPVDNLAPAVLLVMGMAFLIPFRLKKPTRKGKTGMLACGSGLLLVLLIGGSL
ncbi:MAG: CDP-alcohol phosphatidyltransferase family protein [Bacillota bacterium]|nr:CDP-alcohol phosphatidyltransferase family protein [Bacillota bacterium]